MDGIDDVPEHIELFVKHHLGGCGGGALLNCFWWDEKEAGFWKGERFWVGEKFIRDAELYHAAQAS